MSTLVYKNNVDDAIKGWSKTKDYQDGLNNIRKEYEMIGESEDYIRDMVSGFLDLELWNMLDRFEEIQDVLVTGGLGRWNGKFVIKPTREDNLKDAFLDCAANMDEVEIYDNNGVIEIVTYHHDDYNTFNIYQLNSKGINAGDNVDLTKKSYHKKIRLHEY